MTAEGMSFITDLKRPGTREHAEQLVEYLERITREFPAEIWNKRLATAREWLRLTTASHVAPAEESALLDAVCKERNLSHAWWSLAAGVYEWLRNRGVSVPPCAIFFALPDDEYCRKASPQERASLLLQSFYVFQKEDPSNAAWTSGMESMVEWLRLIAAKDLDGASVAALSQRVLEGSEKYYVRLWGNAALGVWTWCFALGFAEIVPESFRSLYSVLNAEHMETNHSP